LSPDSRPSKFPTLAPYFRDCLSASDLNELNIEIIRNTLYKAYLEDFDNFIATEIGGPTYDNMHRILAFEADRRTINITINSFGTELSKEQRARLFPTIGNLFPVGNNMLARADEMEQVKAVCEYVSEYRHFFDAATTAAAATGGNRAAGGANGQAGGEDPTSAIAATLEDRFFATEVHLNKLTFLQQFQYSVFFSYFKLKEHEIRSITWIVECIAQDARDRIQDFIPIF